MRYVFGSFELDTATLELRREGELVEIEPQVFQLLAHLIENRERVLSKDDLIEAIWGGRIVSDAAVSSRIKLVRRAVDDDGRRQEVIKTVHGKGFRFIAELDDAPSEDSAPAPEVRPPTSPSNWKRLAVPAGLVAIALVCLVILLQLFPSRSVSGGAKVAVLPVVNDTGDASLDWTELGLMSLLIQDLGSRSELPLVDATTVMVLADRFTPAIETDLSPSDPMTAALQDGHGVSHIVSARLTGTADNLTLEYRILNPRGEAVPASVSGDMASGLATEVSRRVAATLPRSGERRSDAQAQQFDDAFVAETYARGRDLQMQGQGAKAADMFRVAVAQDPDNLQLRLELARSTRLAGDLDDAQAQLDELLVEAQNADDTELQGAVLNGLGVVYTNAREDAKALAAYQAALDVLGPNGSASLRARALTNIGIIQRRQRDYEGAEETLGQALVTYEDAGYSSPPGHLLNTLALLKVQMRDVPQANEYLEQALVSFRMVGDRHAEAAVLHNLGTNWSEEGHYEKGRTLLLSALSMREKMGDVRGQMSSYGSLANVAINAGDAGAAMADAQAMIDLAKAHDDRYQLARAYGIASYVALVQGDWSASERYSASAEEIFTSLSRTRNAQREKVRQAVARGFAGSDEHAAVQDVIAWAVGDNQKGTQLSSLEALTVLSILDRDWPTALQHIDEAIALATELHFNSVVGRLAARQGLIRLMMGDTEGATASLGRAKAGFAEHRDTLLLEALLARSQGRTTEAAQLLDHAKEISGDNWLLLERLFTDAFDQG
ncbi:MAG: winged helix-turn-helix domain-containing protein [Pseudomonadota bacterium]